MMEETITIFVSEYEFKYARSGENYYGLKERRSPKDILVNVPISKVKSVNDFGISVYGNDV